MAARKGGSKGGGSVRKGGGSKRGSDRGSSRVSDKAKRTDGCFKQSPNKIQDTHPPPPRKKPPRK
jgi:hypothetical protein